MTGGQSDLVWAGAAFPPCERGHSIRLPLGCGVCQHLRIQCCISVAGQPSKTKAVWEGKLGWEKSFPWSFASFAYRKTVIKKKKKTFTRKIAVHRIIDPFIQNFKWHKTKGMSISATRAVWSVHQCKARTHDEANNLLPLHLNKWTVISETFLLTSYLWHLQQDISLESKCWYKGERDPRRSSKIHLLNKAASLCAPGLFHLLWQWTLLPTFLTAATTQQSTVQFGCGHRWQHC